MAAEPTERQRAYGQFASKVIVGSPYYKDLQDRAAYVAITGQLPSHLRKEYTAVLRQVTEAAVLCSLDRRGGYCIVKPFPFRHLKISDHPMYLAARSYVERGYRITASRGFGTRRNYGRIFLSLENENGSIAHRLTIKLDGAVKQDW